MRTGHKVQVDSRKLLATMEAAASTLGVKEAELCKMVGISRTYMSQLRRNPAHIRVHESNVELIAKALGVKRGTFLWRHRRQDSTNGTTPPQVVSTSTHDPIKLVRVFITQVRQLSQPDQAFAQRLLREILEGHLDDTQN